MLVLEAKEVQVLQVVLEELLEMPAVLDHQVQQEILEVVEIIQAAPAVHQVQVVHQVELQVVILLRGPNLSH
jgi:hypothetical protein